MLRVAFSSRGRRRKPSLHVYISFTRDREEEKEPPYRVPEPSPPVEELRPGVPGEEPQEPGPRPDMPRIVPDLGPLERARDKLVRRAKLVNRYNDIKLVNEVFEKIASKAEGRDDAWVRASATAYEKFFNKAWNLGLRVNLAIRGPCVASTTPKWINGACKSLLLCDSPLGFRILDDPRPEEACGEKTKTLSQYREELLERLDQEFRGLDTWHPIANAIKKHYKQFIMDKFYWNPPKTANERDNVYRTILKSMQYAAKALRDIKNRGLDLKYVSHKRCSIAGVDENKEIKICFMPRDYWYEVIYY